MPLKAPERYEIPYTAPPAIGNNFFKNGKKDFLRTLHSILHEKKKKVNYESVPRWESETRAAGA